MARDRTGIKTLGKNKFLVRVTRKEKRTGLTVNRKQIVDGTPEDAERVREELRAELKSTADKRPRTRLRDYLVSWLERRANNKELRDTTVRKYGYGIQHVIDSRLGDIYMDALTREDVKDFIAARIAAVGIKGGNTVLNELRMLRTVATIFSACGSAASSRCRAYGIGTSSLHTRASGASSS